MEGLVALTILFGIFGLGDYISSKTKAIFSTLFVSSIVLLVGFWMGMPKDIFKVSSLLPMGIVFMGILITHMGTLMNINDLIKQWKTVVIALASVIGIALVVYLIGSMFIGKEYSAAAAPPIAGGVVAGIIVGEAAKLKGLDLIIVFSTLLVAVQGFLGYPIASICLSKEARRLLRDNKNLGTEKLNSNKNELENDKDIKISKFKIIKNMPKTLQTPSIIIAKLGLVAILSFKLADLTGGVINKYVICLIMGVILKEVGFLEENALTKANAFGFAMGCITVVIFANLANATPQMVLMLLKPIVISLILGVIGVAVTSIPIGKIFGVSYYMSFAIGITALFGFPGTYILSNEIANAEGKNKEEKEFITNEILPKMLIAGFVTVTIASVVLAGFMAKLI